MKFVLTVDCDGPSFRTADGQSDVERGVADILLDVVDSLSSGTDLVDLHGQLIRGRSGEKAAAIMVSTLKRV